MLSQKWGIAVSAVMANRASSLVFGCAAGKMPAFRDRLEAYSIPGFHHPLIHHSRIPARMPAQPADTMNYLIRMFYLFVIYSALILAQPI
jgi:hypothetical protein